MELSTTTTPSDNWTTIDGMTPLPIHISPNNWTTLEDMTNDTHLNISSLYSRNVSFTTALNDRDESAPAWLFYVLLSLNVLFLVFGWFGNISGIIVMLRLSSKLQAYVLLVVSLAITDIMGVTTNFFHMLPVVLNYDMRALTRTGCTVFMIFDLSVKKFSSYIIVLICIDRFLAVKYPLQFKQIVSRKVRIVSLCVCGGIALFVGVMNAVQNSEIENGICQLYSNEYLSESTVTQRGLRILFLVIFTGIPMGIILCLTPVIIFQLSQQQAIRERLSSKEDANRLIRTTVMLICIVVAYIILVSAPSVVFAAFRIGGKGGNASNGIILLLIATALAINHSINICFYVISNKEFRENFVGLFSCCCKSGRPSTETNQAMPNGDLPNTKPQ